MFFVLPKDKKLLSVDDAFATLKAIHENGDFEFEFRYSVKQSEVIPRNALTVSIRVVDRVQQSKPIIERSSSNKIDVKQ